ncbi:MAG: hypothetical protein H7A36_03075 [Chlamydiales bacterium]|nr:hypothetical protein [Chlamydiales bacterium]
MRLLFSFFILTSCLLQRSDHYFTCTIFAVEGAFQQASEGWGVLRLYGVDKLASFQKENQKGKMSVEDFFTAWSLNDSSAKGELSYAKKKRRSVAVRNPQYLAQSDELTLMIQPIDWVVPTQLERVELKLLLSTEEQRFWDQWMGQ